MSKKTKHRHKNEIETKNLAPVNEAVKEYRVIEDGAYAYNLQNEEIENHYSQNVNMRRTVMEDIRRAKELQDEEDRKARILTLDEEHEIKQLDEELAEMIQEEIFVSSAREEQERKEREVRDEELALLLEEKDRRKVERARSELDHDRVIAARMQNMAVTPPSSRDQQRMRLMTDEELAKRLQDEEKLKANRLKERKEEFKSVVQMQDEELAKYIHEKEIEAAEMKFRKERERRRSKKKGKWDDEPLYYDDNIHPPVYQEMGPKQDERHPINHPPRRNDPRHSSDPRQAPQRPSNPPRHPDSRQPPDYHSRPPAGRKSERSPTMPDQAPRHSLRSSGSRKPERPPPPQFSESHITEVKVPIDQGQKDRHHNESARRLHDGRNSPLDVQSRRAHSEKQRRYHDSPNSEDSSRRSYSEKPGQRKPHDGRREQSNGYARRPEDDRLRRDDRHNPRMQNSDKSTKSESRHRDDRDRRAYDNGPSPRSREYVAHSQSSPDPGNIRRR